MTTKNPLINPNPPHDGRGHRAICSNFQDGPLGEQTRSGKGIDFDLLQTLTGFDRRALKLILSLEPGVQKSKVRAQQLLHRVITVNQLPDVGPRLRQHRLLKRVIKKAKPPRIRLRKINLP